MHWKVVRKRQTDKSTTGRFIAYGANGKVMLQLTTLENPWLNNKRNLSCIPAGEYRLEKRTNSEWNPKHKRKFGMNYIVGIEGVPNREGVIVHEGNYPEDTKGCILLGTTVREDFVGSSKNAVEKFYKLCSNYGVPPKIAIVEEFEDG